MAQEGLFFEWGLRGKLEEQIRNATKDTERLVEVIEKLNVDTTKLDASKMEQSIKKNVDVAEKSLYKLMEAKEKLDKALSRNTTMRADNFLGLDESGLIKISGRIDEIIGKVMNIGAEAIYSKTAVKDLLTTLSADLVVKNASSAVSVFDKGLDKQVKERAKAQKDAIKEIEKAERDQANATAANARNQELIRNALAKIATARANLSAASEKGSQQDIAHAQLLMSLLDRLATKLNGMKSTFLGESGALAGILGSGYQGLMRNVSTAIRDIGRVSGSITQSPVDLLAGKESSIQRIQQITTEMDALKKRLQDLSNEQSRGVFRPKDVESIQQRYSSLKAELDSLVATMRRLGELSNVYGGLGHLRGYTGPQTAMSEEAWNAAKREAEIREVAAQAAERHRQKLEELNAAFEKQAKAEERANKEAANAAAQQERATARQNAQYQARQKNTQATRQQAEELVRLRMELLRTQAAELQSLMKNGRGTFSTQQYQQVQDALRSVRKEMAELEGVMQRMSTYSIRDLFNFGRGTQNWSPLIQNSQAVLAAQQSIRQLSAEEEKLMQSFERANSSMNNQSRLLGDLQTMVANYLSLWGMRGFLNNIIEIGGQLEMQRLSIAAILGDAAQANDLFEKIKSLAIQSPFGVVELDQYTKQLSAYGFKYNELYDMTKRLADISAGAGTQVGRLALALGHVRSEGALTGYTLRQFAMNNIPMLGELSKQLTEVEGKLVTTAEIRKRIHDKQIGYEEVEAVIKKLTDEGGMFYNMQEVVSQSVKARFKNLKDSLDIMYGEMAESDLGGELKVVATTLTGLTRHWKELFSVLRAGAIILGGIKLLSIQNRILLGAEAAAVQKGVTAKVRADAANIKLASSYRSLTAAEQAFTGARGEALVVANALALSEKKLTAEGVARQVALGRLTKAEAHQAIALADLTVAEKMHAHAIVGNVYTYGRFTGVVNAAAMSIRKLGVALKGLVWNPLTAIFAVVGIGTELWQRNNEEVERAKTLNDDLFNRAQEGIKNIKEMMGETGMAFKVNGVVSDFGSIDDLKNGGKFEFKPVDKVSSAEMTAAIESWTQFIKDYAANKNNILNDAFLDDAGRVRSIGEQYTKLGEAVGKTAEAYAWLKQASEAAEYGENVTNGGLFNDDLITNIGDYSDAQKEYNNAVSDSVRKHRQFYSVILKAARQNTIFAATLRTQKVDAENLGEQIKILLGNQEKYAKAIEAAKDASEKLGHTKDLFGSLVDDRNRLGFNDTLADYQASVSNARATMEADIDLFVDGMKQRLSELGWNIKSLTKGQEYAIGLSIADIVAKVSKGTDDVRNEVTKLMREKFGIEIDADTAEAVAKISQLKQSLEQLVDHEWHIDIKTATNFADVISNVRKSYKSAKEYFENVKPLMIKMGVSVSGGMKELGQVRRSALLEQWKKDNPGKNATMFEMMLQDWDDWAQQMNDALDFSKKTGIGLEDPNKKKNKSGNKTDNLLKEAKRRLDEVKDFYAEYKKYRDQYGEEKGFDMVVDIFGMDRKKAREIVDNYKRVLKDILDSVPQNTEERKKFAISLKKLLGDIQLDDLKNELSKKLKELERYIQDETSKWNLYKGLLDKTGSKEFAMQAFVDGIQWDDMTRSMAEKLREMMSSGKIAAHGGDLFEMDEEQAEKFFGKGTEELKLWQEIVKDIRKNWTDSLNEVAAATEKLLTIEEKIAKTEQELAELRRKYGANDPRSLAKEKELGKLQVDAFEQSGEYLRFYTAVLSMTVDEAEKAGLAIRQKLVDQLAKGKINADKYLKSIKNIEQQLEKSRSNSQKGRFFIEGGLEARAQRKYDAAYDEYSAKALAVQEAEKDLLDARKNGDEYLIEVARRRLEISQMELENAEKRAILSENELKALKNFAKDLDTAVQIIHGMKEAVDIWQDFAKAVDGEEMEVSAWFEDTIGVLDGIGQAFQNVIQSAMSGNVSGMITGAVSILSNPIKALAQNHDKRRQRDIEKSERRVHALTTAFQNLQSAMESALGGIYTTGGYDEMFENLEKRRNELQRQYESELDKKAADKDKLADYEQQISEMDESIKNFALDMAKALYDIDLQGWASQLTEAIVNAWEKGEDAVEAYRSKVKEIMKDLTTNILAKKVMERAFESLGIDDIIAGMMDASSGKLDESMIPKLSEALIKVGDTTAGVITGVLDNLEGRGYIEKDSDSASKSSTSTSIKSITEETADLLASYINAIRADVSVNRMTLTEILYAVQGQSEMPIIARAQLQQLEQVAANTQRNADAAEMIYEVLHANVLGANAFKVK